MVTRQVKTILFSLINISYFFSTDASELSWTYPLQGIAFDWIHQREETENELKIIECICGERIEEQLEFELDAELFRFDDRQINSK